MAFESPLISRLDAVNTMLMSMGEPSINSLEGAAVDANMANDLITEVSTAVQNKGWHWNTEVHKLSPSNTGEINLPANTARVDAIRESRGTDVVQRGLRLFDRENNSYVFATALTLELIVILDFAELPLSAKRYIVTRAARLLQERLLGSDTLSKFTQNDEATAWLDLMEAETQTRGDNMLSGSWSVASILARGNF